MSKKNNRSEEQIEKKFEVLEGTQIGNDYFEKGQIVGQEEADLISANFPEAIKEI